ncbi:unnamed protein product [Brachionus calyciflorus]|uniref:Retrovirus-related Pol polyprotein from transposon TNT 1-94-like beta-barrel domain-containing protein n=1 Tax=Brachionus calyciflorus TaxID=104777 RepID=A0A814HKX2_9BILA|nr:unnamed protein product [Brachionus calyciflorus]
MNLSVNQSLLTTDFIINWNEYLFSILCFLGSITSLINIFIFYKIRLKDQIFKYYLTTSIIDFGYTLILGLNSIVNCGTSCKERTESLVGKFYELILCEYLTSSFAITGILIDLFVSVQRLLVVVSNPVLTYLNPSFVVIVLITAGLFYYIPVLFVKKISEIGPKVYKLQYTQFGNSEFGKVVPIFLSSIRLILASVILFIINLFTLFQLTKRIKKESIVNIFVSNLNEENSSLKFLTKKRKFFTTRLKAKKNITLMIISIAFTYTIGTLPWAFYYSISSFFREKSIFIHVVMYTIGAAFIELEAKGIGDIVAKIKSKNEIKSITIENALYVPDLNLISIGKLSSKGYKIVFEKEKCLILKKASIIESNSWKQNNNLYQLKLFFQDNKRQKENKFEINKENKVNMVVKNKPKKTVKFPECTKYECFMIRSKNSLEHLERCERDGIMVRKNNSQKELKSSYNEKRINNNSFSSKVSYYISKYFLVLLFSS